MALFLHHGKFISVVGFHLPILIHFKNTEDNTIISYTAMMFYNNNNNNNNNNIIHLYSTINTNNYS